LAVFMLLTIYSVRGTEVADIRLLRVVAGYSLTDKSSNKDITE